MSVRLPEKNRDRKKVSRGGTVLSGSKDSNKILTRDILKSFEKSTSSSAQQKTYDFLKRNEADRPDHSELISAIDESFEFDNKYASLSKDEKVLRSRSQDLVAFSKKSQEYYQSRTKTPKLEIQDGVNQQNSDEITKFIFQ
ncbi:UNKNOWN [Stylonychia lemnae]|uniref:Uncharacterized protein n=1 Tax=Stylonychia lemnae TaxID=5949 RepID=A0A078AP01_STYLE|nr:UNKNOWN [Stylonychia lemnae]|eukprot:CDW83656.1 UNKNOWN [Stylonychia lemnae]